MLTGDIQPDDLGNNAEMIAAIRNQLFDDSTPFLLLPVRIETRFMKVARPVKGQPTRPTDLFRGLEQIDATLRQLAQLDLRVEGPNHHDRERALYHRLDAALAPVGGARKLLTRIEDVAAWTPDEAKTLADLKHSLEQSQSLATSNLETLRSEYQRNRLLAALKASGLDGFFQTLERRVFPKIEMLRELPIGPLRHAPKAAVQPELLHGTTDELSEHARTLPRPLRVLTQAQLGDAAEAFADLQRQLAALEAALDAEPKRRRVEWGVETAQRVTQTLQRAEAARRAIPVLPAEWAERLQARADALLPQLDGLADRLARMTAGGSLDGRRGELWVATLRRGKESLERATRAKAPNALPTFAVATDTQIVNELWVRIYPDDIAVHTHEPALTEREVAAGKVFWQQTVSAGGDVNLERGAWRVLALRHGSRRAAWVAQQTRPKQLPNPSPSRVLDGLKRIDARIRDTAHVRSKEARTRRIDRAIDEALVMAEGARAPMAHAHRREVQGLLQSIRAKLAGEGPEAARRSGRKLAELEKALGALQPAEGTLELAFPQPELKASSWTTAPHCKVLPDRFVVLTVNAAGEVTHAVAGKPVGDTVVGLDPTAPPGSYGIDAQGNLQVPESIRWMTDFDAAVAAGMAVTFPISSDEAQDGFSRVLVVGVRAGDPDGSRQLLEGLLENHRFGQSGLALLPVGTPTNNTEEQSAGWKSADDPERSFDLERGPPQFDPAVAHPFGPADGQRLASAWGVDPQALSRTEAAGGHDVGESLSLNTALWPATGGAYLEEMLGNLLTVDTLGRVGQFYRAAVIARGMLPAFRVAGQPYGVLCTTALSRWVPPGGDIVPPLPAGGVMALSEAQRAARFDILLRDVLVELVKDWTQIRATKVKHAHSPGVTDPKQHFLEMLGLLPVSQSSSYRFGINAGLRHGDAGDPDFDVQSGPRRLLERFETVLRRAFSVDPAQPLLAIDPATGKPTGAYSPAFGPIAEAAAGMRIFEARFLDTAKPLTGAVTDAAQGWLAGLLAASPRALETAARTGAGPSHSLLFLLLREALLFAFREAGLDILQAEGMLTEEARRKAGSSSAFLVRTLSQDEFVTKWSYLFAPLSQLDGRFDIHFPNGPNSLYHYLKGAGGPERTLADYLSGRGQGAVFNGFPGRAAHAPFIAPLQDHAAQAQRLGTIPPDRLSRLLREHANSVSHRLDAWLSGLAHQRLSQLRAQQPRGIHLGAYGWVQDLKPGAPRTVAVDLPDSLHAPGDPPVYDDPDGQGFIHAPSPTHAVAAAILRCGYLSEADEPDLKNRMAVNISSRRVRLALDLLDGLREGNDLGALLGYRLERSLHDAYEKEGVTLDTFIGPLRRAFPSQAKVDPQELTPGQTPRLVIDGLSLLRTVEEAASPVDGEETLFDVLEGGGSFPGFPWGLLDDQDHPLLPSPFTAAGAPKVRAFLRAVDEAADALDALGDLSVAEGVFQLARGNHSRAAATVSAMAEGRAMPEPQLVDLQPTGTTVQHRLLLTFDAIDGASLSQIEVANPAVLAANRLAALPDGWKGIPMTPRVNAEPALNRWLGELLGPADQIRAVASAPNGGPSVEVSAADLGLQPMDWLAILGPGLLQAEREIATRVIQIANAAIADPSQWPQLKVELHQRPAAWNTDRKTFFEIAPLLAALHRLLSKSRVATAAEFSLEETRGVAPPPGSDLAELGVRAANARAQLESLWVDLFTFLEGGVVPTAAELAALDDTAVFDDAAALLADAAALWGARANVRTLLLRAAAFEISVALPPVEFDGLDQAGRRLADQLRSAFTEVTARLRAAPPIAQPPPTADVALQALSKLFGATSFVLPAFPAPAAGANTLAGVEPERIDDWFEGVAAVRESARWLERVCLLGEAFQAPPLDWRVLQLPFVAGDRWLGSVFAPDQPPSGDKLSVVVADAGTGAQAAEGIVVDQWTELIPSRARTTGIAFHYEQPDAMPPQAVLLAVPPRMSGRWNWDDLARTLDETLDLSMNRMVELEHLFGEIEGQLLPAIQGEVVPHRVVDPGQEVPGSRVILDFGFNNR